MRCTHPGDVAGRYHAALDAGDAEASSAPSARMGTRASPSTRRPLAGAADELRAFFTACFSAGGGVGLEPCVVTDDGVRRAVEYNSVRWGGHELPPQAGIGVYERGADGLLSAARVYDDIEPPVQYP